MRKLQSYHTWRPNPAVFLCRAILLRNTNNMFSFYDCAIRDIHPSTVPDGLCLGTDTARSKEDQLHVYIMGRIHRRRRIANRSGSFATVENTKMELMRARYIAEHKPMILTSTILIGSLPTPVDSMILEIANRVT